MAIEETELSNEKQARKRAAVALGSLAIVAILIVVLIVALSGGRSKQPSRTVAQHVPPSRSATASSASAPASRHATRSASSTSPKPSSSSAKPRQHRLSGDVGNVLRAINKLRADHGVRPVSGAVTRAASTCAANSGDGSACPSSYFWEPVSGPDGAQVVQKIVNNSSGASFLLDVNMKRVQIGWKSLGNGEWECAVIGGY